MSFKVSTGPGGEVIIERGRFPGAPVTGLVHPSNPPTFPESPASGTDRVDADIEKLLAGRARTNAPQAPPSPDPDKVIATIKGVVAKHPNLSVTLGLVTKSRLMTGGYCQDVHVVQKGVEKPVTTFAVSTVAGFEGATYGLTQISERQVRQSILDALEAQRRASYG